MPMDRFNYLLRQYAANTATVEEVEELFTWLSQHKENEVLQTELEAMAHGTSPSQNYDPAHWEAFIQQVLQTPSAISYNHPVKKIGNRIWFRYAAAASILLLTGLAVFYFWNTRKSVPSLTQTTNSQSSQDDAIPGKQGAILTLADGQKILLDHLGNGLVATQGKTILLIKNGRLIYDAKATGEDMHYNTMTVPKGRQFQLVLPDGTRVWLNAESSITYPAAFSGNERKVAITGEVYFEVSKDKLKPFRVNVNDQAVVEVMGTHFNINSYADAGSVKTTLLEGSVKVLTNHGQVVLKPGQQAQLAGEQKMKIVQNADLTQVMAWKNGLFNFDHADLKTVMQQLARWYDMDVRYEGNIPPRTFRGKITRDLHLSQVIKILEDVDVKFRIEGKTLVVMP